MIGSIVKLILKFRRKEGDFRVQLFTECIRVHPKDEHLKIKAIHEESLRVFAIAHQTQQKIQREKNR